MSHPNSAQRRRRRARTAALTALAIAAAGGTAAGPAQAKPLGPCDGPCPRVTVADSTYAYSTPYLNARSKQPLRPATYDATCEAQVSPAGPNDDSWWTRLREGAWVNNNDLRGGVAVRGGVKMGIGDCAAPPNDRQPPDPRGAIGTRQDVMNRSATWIQRGIMYSQTLRTDGYRRDCSGYVSMAWRLPTTGGGATSYGLIGPRYTVRIPKSALQPGDMLGKPGHVALFVRYAADGRPVVREEFDYGNPAVQRIWSKSWFAGFSAYRYRNIR